MPISYIIILIQQNYFQVCSDLAKFLDISAKSFIPCARNIDIVSRFVRNIRLTLTLEIILLLYLVPYLANQLNRLIITVPST